MRVGVVGPGSFVPPPAANPTVAVTVPQPIHSRPTLPQLSLFPMVPPVVPHSTAAVLSPTAVGRVGVIGIIVIIIIYYGYLWSHINTTHPA